MEPNEVVSDYPSLSYAHDEVKEQVDFQIARIRGFEATVGILIGISVTAMSIVMGNSILLESHLYLTLPTVCLFALTVLGGIYTLWHVGYYRPVDPVVLFNDYLEVEDAITKFVATSVMVDAYIRKGEYWRLKRRQFLRCLFPLVLAIIMLTASATTA